MSKLSKHAEVLSHLHKLIEKEAEKPEATGKPGADTHYQSVSEKTEHTDKNKVGPDKLEPQKHDQHKATDASTPIHKASEETPEKPEEKAAAAAETEKQAEAPKAEETPEKKADETEGKETEKSATAIGKEVLAMISEYTKAASEKEKEAKEKPEATGKPGADTHYESVSEKTEHTDKNKVGPDKLTPQKHEQHKATDHAVPVAKAAEENTEVDVNKVASFELGKSLAEMFLKSAEEQEINMLKEAGRRDFETLISQAAAELGKEAKSEPVKTAAVVDKEAEDQAEKLGAAAFQELLKQAEQEQAEAAIKKTADENEAKLKQLEVEKAAALKQVEEVKASLADYQKKAAEQAEMAKFAAMADYIKNEVINALKQEALQSK